MGQLSASRYDEGGGVSCAGRREQKAAPKVRGKESQRCVGSGSVWLRPEGHEQHFGNKFMGGAGEPNGQKSGGRAREALCARVG